MFESVYKRCGKAIFTQPIVTAAGRLDRRGEAPPRDSEGRRTEATMPALLTPSKVEGSQSNGRHANDLGGSSEPSTPASLTADSVV